MITKNLRSIKLLTTSRYSFSCKESQWMDSPFITKPPTPAYFRMWHQINQYHDRMAPLQNYSETLNPTNCEVSHNIVASEDGLAQSIEVRENVSIPEQPRNGENVKSRRGRKLRAVNTRPFKK